MIHDMGNWDKIKEKWLKKDHLLILVLVGVLLLVISIPVGEQEEENVNNSTTVGMADIMTGITGQQDEKNMSSGSLAAAGGVSNTAGLSMSYEKEMEQRLLSLLAGVKGVGEAKVMITLRTSEEILLDKEEESSRSETSESDSAGGSREVLQRDNRESTVLVTNDGENVPVRVKTIYPEIEGVVVAAQGAGTGDVSTQISELVQVLFGIEAHRVKIVRLE